MSDDFEEWLRRSCEEQGVPLKVTDPTTLRRIAVLFTGKGDPPSPRGD